jgi:hypothetical protein
LVFNTVGDATGVTIAVDGDDFAFVSDADAIGSATNGTTNGVVDSIVGAGANVAAASIGDVAIGNSVLMPLIPLSEFSSAILFFYRRRKKCEANTNLQFKKIQATGL